MSIPTLLGDGCIGGVNCEIYGCRAVSGLILHFAFRFVLSAGVFCMALWIALS